MGVFIVAIQVLDHVIQHVEVSIVLWEVPLGVLYVIVVVLQVRHLVLHLVLLEVRRHVLQTFGISTHEIMLHRHLGLGNGVGRGKAAMAIALRLEMRVDGLPRVDLRLARPELTDYALFVIIH